MKRWHRKIGLLAALVLMAASVPAPDAIAKEEATDTDFYSCKLSSKTKLIQSQEGRSYSLSIRLKNTGQKTWQSEGPYPVLLSYHLMDSTGHCLQYDNRRYSLSQRIEPKDSITLPVTVKIPLQTGNFILVFDLVREGKAWFEDYGSKPLQIELEISPNNWTDFKDQKILSPGSYTYFKSVHPVLNDIYTLIRLTLEENAITFRGRSGLVSGFAAGSDYPQFWLRDAQTILMVSKYFYDHDYLASWIEEHLFFQSKDGSLSDWINIRGQSDKNTTETDQEASAVLAAGQVFDLIGTEWLEKDINGETLISRLERALGYVLSHSLDPDTGLLKGAHTADWGDVDLVDQDQKAVYTDEKTRWTSDIYDQSMFYSASLELCRMLSALGEDEKAVNWKNRAASLRLNTDKYLWQESKGYYRIHRHLTPLDHDFDEDAMFALGGNTLAVLSGIADRKKTSLIIQEALERQNQFQMSTISATLLPPYPKNTFRHPLMDDPYEYQNGAQWDWFGGRLITAMFQNGFSLEARDKLLEIAEKNRENRGFYEWDTRDGVGKGSDLFCGSAGVLGQAVIEGYYGVSITRTGVRLSPKLGQDPGKIHVFVPALKKFLAYEYRFDSEGKKIIMDINSDHEASGIIRVLSPWGKTKKEALSVLLNGKKTNFRFEHFLDDVYIVFETGFSGLHIEISLS